MIAMNRPEKRNALSLQMMRELDAALAVAGGDPEIRAVIIRGEGPAFSAPGTICANCSIAMPKPIARFSTRALR